MLLVLLIVGFASCADHGPEVALEDGALLGSFMTTRLGRKFSAFQGIPYAEPPLNELRFQPPKPKAPWSNVLNATEIHAVCPQRDIYRRATLIEGEENCLFLNVYTPQLPSFGSDPLPVMVFFHGGGWLCGGGNSMWYGPGLLLDRDIVLVVTNYRVGPLGFLATGDEVVPGNNGLKDQLLALKWVQKNIAKFGGDPNLVTIFGESAGGASSQFHMVSPLSKGLFKRAITESGTAMCNWAVSAPGKTEENSRKLASSLNCPTESSKEMVECLRNIDAIKLIEQDQVFMDWDFDPMIPFKPVVEPDVPGAFLKEHPVKSIEEGRYEQVPLIVGLNSDDGALRAAGLFGNPHLLDEINDDFDRIIPISLVYEPTSKRVDFVTKQIKKFYFNNKKIGVEDRQKVVDLYTDGWFLSCADKAVVMHKKYSKSPVYYYLFGFRGQSSFTEIFGDKKNDYGVCHADELQYLFPVGDGLFPDKKPNEEEKRIAELLTTMWTNFAKTGDPTPELTEVIPEKWSPVKTDDLEYYLIDSKPPRMKTNLYKDRVNFWRSLPYNPFLSDKVKDEL